LRRPAAIHIQDAFGDERIFEQCDNRLSGFLDSAEATNGM